MDGRPVQKRWVAHDRQGLSGPHLDPKPSLRLWPGQSDARSAALGRVGGSSMIQLDGSAGEGGGQILRTALSISLITRSPFTIRNIRANRPKRGLRPQHVAAVEAAAQLGKATVEGARVGARELTFVPDNEYAARDLTIDIGTAGATALVLQTLHLPIALRAAQTVEIRLKGGTFNAAAPSFPFLESTWRETLAAIGLNVSISSRAAGFYPMGGGSIQTVIEPGRPRASTFRERGPLHAIRGVSGVLNLHRSRVAERMRDTANELLAAHGHAAEIDLQQWQGVGFGASLSLSALYDDGIRRTFVGLGERGKPAEAVAEEAVAELIDFDSSTGVVDPHTADQLLLPLALAEGSSSFSTTAVTPHLRTNADTIMAFLDRRIRVAVQESGVGLVAIE